MWLLEPVLLTLAGIAASSFFSATLAVAAIVGWVFLWPWCRFPWLYSPPPAEREGLAYLQLYFTGALIATLLHKRAAAGLPPSLPYAACGGVVVLTALFCGLPSSLSF